MSWVSSLAGKVKGGVQSFLTGTPSAPPTLSPAPSSGGVKGALGAIQAAAVSGAQTAASGALASILDAARDKAKTAVTQVGNALSEQVGNVVSAAAKPVASAVVEDFVSRYKWPLVLGGTVLLGAVTYRLVRK